ncbi:hypothetical protein ScPMuIL_004176 [Solemya velum]
MKYRDPRRKVKCYCTGYTPQFELKVVSIGGYANSTARTADRSNVIEDEYQLFYDGIGNRTAEIRTYRYEDGSSQTVKRVNLFQQRVTYSIIVTQGICVRRAMTADRVIGRRCIPDVARLMASSQVGDSQHPIATIRWAWMDTSNTTIHRVVTSEGCAPVMEGYYTTGETPAFITNLYTDYKAGITDMSIFSLSGYSCPT